MAIIQLGPASLAPAAPPPPQGVAAVRADAGLTVGSMRDMIAVARDFMQLWKEAAPMLEMLRPAAPVDAGPQSVVVHREDAGPGRTPDPVAARVAGAQPPASEVDAGRAEEVKKARADLEKLIRERLKKEQVAKLAAEVGPFALAEKFPVLAEALGNRAGQVEALLLSLSDAEFHGVVGELLPLIPAKDLPTARLGLMQAVQAFEKADAEPKPAEAAPEPAKDDAPKDGEAP